MASRLHQLINERNELRGRILTLPMALASELCGSADLEECVGYLDSWIDWLDEQPLRPLEWDGWQDCHESFAAHLQAAVLAAGFQMS